MTTKEKETVKTNELNFSEAPSSWNTRYISPDGFECQITLRGENGSELLERANNAIAYLLKNGCMPIFTASKIIGHARPSITSDTYGHLIPGAASGIGQLMDDLVAPVSVDLPVAPGCTRRHHPAKIIETLKKKTA